MRYLFNIFTSERNLKNFLLAFLTTKMSDAPKKRGRRPLSEEQKAERRLEKKRQKEDEKQQQAPLHISFMSNDTPNAPAARVLPAHEVIQLLNTSSDRPSIPQRQTPVEPPAPPPPSSRCTDFLQESDDDDDYGANERTQQHLGNISAEQVVTLMGAHTNVNEYPSSTTVWCHHCAHPFEGVPVMLPTMRCVVSKRFECHGTFCSFNCAKRRALDMNQPRSVEMCALVSQFYKAVTGVRERVIAAPPRIALKAFGGTMSIEEFRASFLQLPPKEGRSNRKMIVTELQKNVWPQLAKLHIINEQAVVDERILGPRPRRAVARMDRSKPLRESTLSGMGVNMRVVHDANEVVEDDF